MDIAVGTGRRISAICQLRFRDLRLSDATPHGSICWPADTDKTGRETTVPIDPTVRGALDRIIQERPGIGEAPLFPQPGKLPAEPITRHLATRWLREAEKAAGLEHQRGGAWHPYRRMWATARKGLPIQDVAAAGGWKTTRVVQDIYQRPDSDTMLEVVLAGGEVREARG